MHSSDPQGVWSCFVLHPTENSVLERKAPEMEWKVQEEKFSASVFLKYLQFKALLSFWKSLHREAEAMAVGKICIAEGTPEL